LVALSYRITITKVDIITARRCPEEARLFGRAWEA
jgi:hypothetical protein